MWADRELLSAFYQLWKVSGGGGGWAEIITSALLLFLLRFESQIGDIELKGVFLSFDTDQTGPGVGAGAELDNWQLGNNTLQMFSVFYRFPFLQNPKMIKAIPDKIKSK